MTVITLELRDDPESRAMAERLVRIQDGLAALPGESWVKLSLLGDQVNVKLLDISS